MSVLLLAYLVTLLVRKPGESITLVDGWMVASFELVATALCVARALVTRRGRAIPLVLGGAVLSWSLGDLTLTAQSVAGSATSPSLADVFYLAFYPLAYVALLLLIRGQVRNGVRTMWLDGAIAGLGAAAVSACFAFNTILHTVGGDVASVATNLAYPIGDVLLLTLVVGGSAMLSGGLNPRWLVLAAACGLNAIGDTFQLFQMAGHASRWSFVLDSVAWPASILLISMSAWMRPRRPAPLATARAASFLLPGVGAGAGLAILFLGNISPVTAVALGLATATLLTVGLRLGLSLRRLRSLTEKRQRQALTDDLTGLGNRRHLFQLLGAFFKDQLDPWTSAGELSLLFIDLDHFKEINDSFGHAAGDDLLRQLGPRLTSTLREGDVLVRVGGDELAVIILNADAAYAAAVAQRLLAKLHEPFILDSVSVRISASIGIASAPSDASDSAQLLRCADLAMYRAKLSRSSFEVYRLELDDRGNRLRLVEDLRVAVERAAFEVHYQSQVHIATGEICGVEALLRWSHPQLGWVPPMDFLPLAEEAGLMQSVTAYVLDEATRQCARWRGLGRSLTVSVNASVSDLLDPVFVDTVASALVRHRLPAEALIVEITETTVITDFEACRAAIDRLRSLGVAVAVDDFGAGVTSLAYLGSLAVGELKLDRSFIVGMASGAEGRDLALVRATIDLGHALGMRVVAEGVENRVTLGLLAAAGCDVAQGFFFSRPVPAADLLLPPTLRIVEPLTVAR